MGKFAKPLRFVASGLIAAAILLFGGGWLVHHYMGNDAPQTVGLTIVRHIKLIAHVPGSDRKKAGTTESKAKSRRMVPGFAQVAFTVGADGRAHDIRVLRSVPKGAYDQAARAVIAAHHFKPPKSAQAARQTEIVHFRVPADAPEKSKDGAGSAN